VLLVGGLLSLALRGSLDCEYACSLGVLAAVISLAALAVALFPTGLVGTVATMAAGDTAGCAVLRIAAA
jgi:hypothetical protein